MTRPSCSTPMANSCEKENLPAVRSESTISDLSDFMPTIHDTYSHEVPDSVLLLSLGQSLFSSINKDVDCPPENSPSVIDSRTTFAKLSSRIQFEEADIKMERETIDAIHGIICRNNLTIPRLFSAVTKNGDKIFPFVTDAGLETYIRNRSFIFELNNTVHNRGYGYRENFVHIVRFVDKQCEEVGSCTIQDLIDNVISKLPVYVPDDPHIAWNDGWFSEKTLDIDAVVEFLSHDHVEIFSLDRENAENDCSRIKVRLTCDAYGIASLWQDCLSPIPSTLVWDESRVYSFTTSISYVHEHHAIATIQTGIFRGRFVYIHRSRVGPPDLRRALAVGAMLSVTAHMTWNTTAQFRALSVITNHNNFEVRKIGGRPPHHQHYSRDDHSHHPPLFTPRFHFDQPPPGFLNLRRDARPTFLFRAMLRRAADSELSMINFADDILVDAMYSHDGLQRRLFKYKTSHRNAPFASFQELEFFLSQRPHLYNFDAVGVSRAPAKEREIALAFIQMISEFGFCGASKQELRFRLVNSSYPLKSIVVDRSLDEYIQQISPVLEVVHLLNPVDTVVMLRGTFIPEEQLFVHHFKPSFIPID